MKKANQNELFQQNRVSRTSLYAIIKLNFKAKQDCLKNIEKTKKKKKNRLIWLPAQIENVTTV